MTLHFRHGEFKGVARTWVSVLPVAELSFGLADLLPCHWVPITWTNDAARVSTSVTKGGACEVMGRPPAPLTVPVAPYHDPKYPTDIAPPIPLAGYTGPRPAGVLSENTV